jgi:hypothetical protein
MQISPSPPPPSSFPAVVVVVLFLLGEEWGMVVVVYSEPQFRHRVGVEAGAFRFLELEGLISGAGLVLFLMLLLLLLLLMPLLLLMVLLLVLLLLDLLLLGLLLLDLLLLDLLLPLLLLALLVLVLVTGEKATEGGSGEVTLPNDVEASSGCDGLQETSRGEEWKPVSSLRFLSIERKTIGCFLDASSFRRLDVETTDDTVGTVGTLLDVGTAADDTVGTGTVTGAAIVAITNGVDVWKRCDLAMSAAVLLCLQRSRRMCERSYWEAEAIMGSRLGSSLPLPSMWFVRTCWFGCWRWDRSCCCCCGFLCWCCCGETGYSRESAKVSQRSVREHACRARASCCSWLSLSYANACPPGK